MKVTLEKDYRKRYTLDDLDRARKVIALEKEDESSPKEWAEYAIGEALKNMDGIATDYLVEVIRAEAHTAKNCRAWNAYGYPEDGTEDMDVWITFLAETEKGFIKGGAYLSDIWGSTSGIPTYKRHMYIRKADWKI